MPPVSPRPLLPQLTSRGFTDLLLWMVGLGLFIGLVFPFAVVLLGVPTAVSLRPPFFAATIAAGLVVGAASHQLARIVVGGRLHQLAERMGYVAAVITEATYEGDRSRCAPEDCALDVDSDDEIGDAASSFNLLMEALSASWAVEEAIADHGRLLAGHLELGALSEAAVDSITTHLGAEAGALCIIEDGEPVVTASSRLEVGGLGCSRLVRDALRTPEALVIDVPEDVQIDATVVRFRPAAVVAAPLHFNDEPVGVLVLAFARRPEPDVLRLLESLRLPTVVALTNALTHERFQRLAAIDPLTGVYNRRFGLARLDEELARSRRSGAPLGVVLFDIDHFKQVNDTHGHATGDRVLRAVARVVRARLREGDVLIRFGGEEFLVLLPGVPSIGVAELAERLRRLLAGVEVDTDRGPLAVTASFGCASYPEHDVATADELIDLADRAMYGSKNEGRDRVTLSHGRVSPEPVA